MRHILRFSVSIRCQYGYYFCSTHQGIEWSVFIMPDTDLENQIITFVTVNFVLHPEKQRTLLGLLIAHSPLEMSDLAKLLNVSIEKLQGVIAKNEFLNLEEARQLAKYFCIFCGS